MKNIIECINEDIFFNSGHSPGIYNFFGSDNEDSYIKNKKHLGPTWEYFNREISYNFNSNGYRSIEFSKIDWQNSVILFGCSCTLGIGLDELDTISYNLNLILKRPVINMGIAGSSMINALHLSTILRNKKIMPYGVGFLWTDYNRTTEYGENNFINHGTWNTEDPLHLFGKYYMLNDNNSQVYAKFIHNITNIMWKDNTKLYTGSLFYDTAKLLNCEHLEILDFSRDLKHPGIETAKTVAKNISKIID